MSKPRLEICATISHLRRRVIDDPESLARIEAKGLDSFLAELELHATNFPVNDQPDSVERVFEPELHQEGRPTVRATQENLPYRFDDNGTVVVKTEDC